MKFDIPTLLLLKNPRKILHGNRKKEGGHRITLPEALLIRKRPTRKAINQNRVRNWRNAPHNPLNKPIRETKLLENILQKRPLNWVISHGHIKLNHASRTDMRPVIPLNEICSKQTIIHNLPPTNKPRLGWAHNRTHHLLQPSIKNLSNNFIDDRITRDKSNVTPWDFPTSWINILIIFGDFIIMLN